MKTEVYNPCQEWMDSLSDLEYADLWKLCEDDNEKIWIVFKNKELFHKSFNNKQFNTITNENN